LPDEVYSAEFRRKIAKKIRKTGGCISIAPSKSTTIVIIDDEVLSLAQIISEAKLSDKGSQLVSSLDDKTSFTPLLHHQSSFLGCSPSF
jgi:hypothetical protein